MFILVSELSANPTPDSSPNLLAQFDNYYVNADALGVRCKQLLRAFLQNPHLRGWGRLQCFAGALAEIYSESQSEPTYDPFSHPSLDCADMFQMCRNLVEQMESKTDTLESFLAEITAKIGGALLQNYMTHVRACLERLQQTLAAAPNASRKRVFTEAVWVVFWLSYQLLQATARIFASTELLVRSWRHIPVLLSGVIHKPPENAVSVVSPDASSFTMRSDVTTEKIPFAFWLANQVENLNYHRREAHVAFTVFEQNERSAGGRQRQMPRDNKEVKLFRCFLKSIEDADVDQFVEVFFHAVQARNVHVQKYAYMNTHCASFPFVAALYEDREPPFRLETGKTEFCTRDYQAQVNEESLLRAQLRQLLGPRTNEFLLRSALPGAPENHLSSLARHYLTLREGLVGRRTAYMTFKLLLILCRLWSEGYSQGMNLVSSDELKAHSHTMKACIKKLIFPVARLLQKLVAQLDDASPLHSVNLPVALALSILENVESEVKAVLAELVSLVTEKISFKYALERRSEEELKRRELSTRAAAAARRRAAT